MLDEFVPELRDRRLQRPGRTVAKGAEGIPEDAAAQEIELFQVPLSALPRLHTVQDLAGPIQPFPAGRAFAAGFFVEELVDVFGGPDDAVPVVEDDDAGGAQHGIDGGQRFEIHGHVKAAFRDHRGRNAAGDDRLDLAPGPGAASVVVDQFPERDAHGQLVHPGLLDVAAQAIELGSWALLGSDAAEPLDPPVDDVGQAGQGLDVVDDGRAFIKSRHGRERRLELGLAPASLDGFEHRRLLAADVGARPHVHVDVEIEAGAENVTAQVSFAIGFGQGRFQPFDAENVFSTDVKVGYLGADGVGSERHAFQHHMRVALHDHPVLEGARLAFVGVAAEILGLVRILRHEAPLEAGREPGPAAALEVGVLDQLDQTVGAEFTQNLGQRLVPARGLVGLDPVGVGLFCVLQKDFLEHGCGNGSLMRLFRRLLAQPVENLVDPRRGQVHVVVAVVHLHHRRALAGAQAFYRG